MAEPTQKELDRRQKKAAVSLIINTIDRYIAEEDIQVVESKLKELKDAFVKFELAHEVYRSLLERPKDIEKSDSLLH